MEFPCCLILKMTPQTLKDLLGAVCALGLPRAHLALTAPLGPGPDAKMLRAATFTAHRRQLTRRTSAPFTEASDLVTGGCGRPGKALSWCSTGFWDRPHEPGPGTPAGPEAAAKHLRRKQYFLR